tara:strand:- start:21 stop:875 length:855 start_codon:yes stop_codon:yes gene_type:complete
MNPIKRLYDNRNNLRKKNLSENIEIWQFIINNINDNNVVAKAMNYETLSFKLKNQKMINRNIEFTKNTEKVLTSIASQIFKMNAIEFEIENIEDIKLDLIKKKINSILNSPSEIQAHFCKNPNKQTCDETLQTLMLNEKINDLNLHASKAKPYMYIFNGEFTKKNKGAKSIDIFIAEKDILPITYFSNTKKFSDKLIFLGYQKTIMVAGGHQNNQLKDILSYINQADEYIKKNNDNVFFFVQADGDYCIDNMSKILKEIQNKKKIFAGTTIEIIEGIKDVSKKI